jgi:MFS family permease
MSLGVIKKFWEDNLLAPKVLYFTMNLAYYSCYTFRAKYLKEQQQIETKDYGLLAAILSLVLFIAGFFWSYLADRTGKSKAILISSALISAGVFQFFIIPFGDLRIPIATLVSGLYIFFSSAYIPLLDAFVMNMLSSHPGMTKDMYGKQRMCGTIGYASIAIFVSYFKLYPTINILIIILSTVFAGFAYIIVKNPEEKIVTDVESKKTLETTDVIQKPEKAAEISNTVVSQDAPQADVKATTVDEKKVTPKVSCGIKKLMTNPNYLFLLLVVFMNGLARGTILITYINVLLAVMTHFLEPIQRNVYKTPAEASGYSAASGVALEVVVFFFSKQLLQYFGVRRMLLISQSAMVCRICCYAFLPRFFPGSQYITIAYELFKGLSFGFMQSASVIWVTEITTPDTKAVGQAIYTGVFSGIAAFTAGIIGYIVQNISVELAPGLTKAEIAVEIIKIEVERSILLLQMTAYVSIFALVLFFVKYIVFEEWIAARRNASKETKEKK